MKKHLILPALSALLFFTGTHAQSINNAAQPVRLTLEECLDIAMGNNYSRQLVLLDESSREASLEQAKTERWPNLTANLGENFSDTKAGGSTWSGNYDLSTNITVYQGGQINNTIKQNRQQVEQTRLQTRRYDNDLVIRILQSFLTVIGNEELLKYQQAVVNASERQAAEGKARFEAGQIIESDYLLLEAQYATDLDNITSTRITRDNSLVALKNLMSMDLAQPVELVYPDDALLESLLDLPTESEVVERGMETMPEVRISDYNVEIAETGLKLAKTSYFPTVSMNAGVGTGHIRDFDSYGKQLGDRFGPSAGVSVSIPIFSRNKTRTNVAQSRIALRQAELDRKQSLSDIEQSLINEYGNVVASGSKYRASEIKRKAYFSSYEAYTEMFGAGAITTVELLQQQNSYISAMNDYINNKYTFLLQRKVLDVYMGEPVKM